MKRAIVLTMPILIVVAALLYIKPLKFLAPCFAGVECYGSVCVDDTKKIESALNLYSSAVERLHKRGISTPLRQKIIYCATIKCYQSFGGGTERAISFPFLGTVISPESWQIYITQHELVHWAQFSEMGAISTMIKPEWFREGMAYYFSEAPESDIPIHYFPMIEKYQKWHVRKTWAEVIQSSQQLK